MRSKVETRARTQQVSYPANNFFDDDLDKPQFEELKSPVCSYNEWDPLEEVIVGRVEGESLRFERAILFTLRHIDKPPRKTIHKCTEELKTILIAFQQT